MVTWDTFPITYKRPENNHYWVYLIWIRLSMKCTNASHKNVMERESHCEEHKMCEWYLNTDVLFAPDNSNLYGRMVLCIRAMVLNDSSHGVLEQLKQHVVQM